MVTLLTPALASADTVTQELSLKLNNLWSADQSNGTATPSLINVGENSVARFTVDVNYELGVSGNVYLTSPGTASINVTSWELYLQKRNSDDVWENFKEKNGNEVKIQVINEPTLLVAGEKTQFPVQTTFVTEPVITGQYRWVTKLNIEQDGQSDPTDYQFIDYIKYIYGP